MTDALVETWNIHIGIILAQSGHPLEKKIAYGMWEWGTR